MEARTASRVAAVTNTIKVRVDATSANRLLLVTCTVLVTGDEFSRGQLAFDSSSLAGQTTIARLTFSRTFPASEGPLRLCGKDFVCVLRGSSP